MESVHSRSERLPVRVHAETVFMLKPCSFCNIQTLTNHPDDRLFLWSDDFQPGGSPW